MRVRNLKYYDFGKGGAGSAGLPVSRVYSCNGAYDPDYTGTGHQPMGFDQMMLFYTQYTVLSSTISVGAVGDDAVRVGIYLSPDFTGINDQIALVENGLIKSSLVDGNAGNGGTGNRIAHITSHCDIRKYFGRVGDITNDSTLKGGAASNPTEQAYYFIVAWNPFDVTAVTDYRFDVLISFDIVFWEPRKLSPS